MTFFQKFNFVLNLLDYAQSEIPLKFFAIFEGFYVYNPSHFCFPGFPENVNELDKMAEVSERLYFRKSSVLNVTPNHQSQLNTTPSTPTVEELYQKSEDIYATIFPSKQVLEGLCNSFSFWGHTLSMTTIFWPFFWPPHPVRKDGPIKKIVLKCHRYHWNSWEKEVQDLVPHVGV